MRRLLRRLAAEPLVHFVLLGALFLGVRALASGPPRGRIDLTAETVQGLRAEHALRRGAPPSPEEEAALVEHYVDDEILYREALALGLDKGDIIVRRRLVQKMQLLAEGDPLDTPDDAEVAAWFAAHAGAYRVAPTVSLEHVFFSSGSSGSGPDAEVRARAAARALAGGAEPAGIGEPFVRGRRLEHATDEAVAEALGPDLAAALPGLDAGVWSGPLRSAYGVHLVRVLERTPGRPARFDEVAGRAREDCARDRRATRSQAALARLRARYEVRR